MSLSSAAAAAGVVAAGAYLNAKFHIAHDLVVNFGFHRMFRSLWFIEDRVKQKRLLNYHLLEEQAAVRPDKIFFINEAGGPNERSWTYRECLRDVQKIANWLMKDLGVEVGEIVALDGQNSPEWILLWLALDAIGAVKSYINCHITGNSLAHCIRLCESRYVIADMETKPLIEASQDGFPNVQAVFVEPGFADRLSDESPIPAERTESIEGNKVSGLVYTSGTTGMPKATQVNYARDILTGFAIAQHLGLTSDSRMYTCMPLYHGAAQMFCIRPCLVVGGSFVLSPKFSHARFWPEIVASRANIVLYVGELCRYLMNAPPSDLDRKHCVKTFWGIGMRPDIWEPFRERFGIEDILETYAASDGVGRSSFNRNRGPFSRHTVGWRGLLWKLLNGRSEAIVKIDVDQDNKLVRDKNGWVVKCATNEPGEAIYKLDTTLADNGYAGNFTTKDSGYFRNRPAWTKRMVSDVFKKGDVWFRSGDMFRMDADGRLFFVDRLGDTFRWKSENVSTNEVSDVLGQFPQIAEANVYGVEAPHADGRCGCAAVTLANGVTEETLDLTGLAQHALTRLPRYAVPIFLRITKALDYTGSMKMQKVRLRQEGMNLDKVEASGDSLYWLPPRGTKYERFEREDFQKVSGGQIQL
ncbi:long-chain fatty acid transport protein [Phyllosticta capitalensis]|uniref:Long-chain fatty acid transport protein n=1 Tax=Phyllosticta capitalensis TaxID=121624 RepID=A0ABR1YXD1_9PEZI